MCLAWFHILQNSFPDRRHLLKDPPLQHKLLAHFLYIEEIMVMLTQSLMISFLFLLRDYFTWIKPFANISLHLELYHHIQIQKFTEKNTISKSTIQQTLQGLGPSPKFLSGVCVVGLFKLYVKYYYYYTCHVMLGAVNVSGFLICMLLLHNCTMNVQ